MHGVPSPSCGLAGFAAAGVRLLVLVAAFGCGGVIDDPPSGSGSPASPDADNAPGRVGAGGASGGSGAGGASAAPELPATEVRVVRLTHTQWQNTVRDLLYLDASDALPEFRPDPLQGGSVFDNGATTLQVDEALFGGYQRAAVELAERVTSDAKRLVLIAPPGWDTPSTGVETFVRAFGERAHRRPLTDAQVAQYVALGEMAPALYPTLTPAQASVRLLIEAFLQAADFLYRVESSTSVVGDVIPLDDWEIASRLSYALWGTMPDDSLRAAAAAGKLVDAGGRAEQVQRMIDDPQVERVVGDFHRQLLEVDGFREISPAATFFPDAPADLGAFAVTENEMFIRDLFASDGGFRALLTSTRTFVNGELAAIYGVSGSFGSEFIAVELDPSERAGLFTQVGFLAKNATSADPDPIHRGVFLAQRIACVHIAAPNVMTPPLPAVEGRTNREIIEEHTEKPGTICASCHSTLINPFGFPFERYDAVGAYRTQDRGFLIDATSSPLIGEAPVMVDGALDLVRALADAPTAHACYLGHWIEYLRGRSEAPEDEPLAARLGEASTGSGLSIRRLLFEIATSPTFANRSAEEIP